MSDNILLIRLREFRDLLGEIKEDNIEIKRRLPALEMQAGGLAASEQHHYASLSSRTDRISIDMERIKRRLDIVEAPAE